MRSSLCFRSPSLAVWLPLFSLALGCSGDGAALPPLCENHCPSETSSVPATTGPDGSAGGARTGDASLSPSAGAATEAALDASGATADAASGTAADAASAPPGEEGGTSGDDAGSEAAPPPPLYTLRVDAPGDGAQVGGSVRVRGFAPGFRNVEVWDETHQMPPLAQGAPESDGAFSLMVDASALTSGPTTWTVWAWDSAPGAAFMHDAHTDIALILKDDAPGADAGPQDAGAPDGATPEAGDETVGTGDVTQPAKGPAPRDADQLGGAPFVLVKNWNFGTRGTIRNTSELIGEFQFHDQFGTIANGTNYGAVIVAPNDATAIGAGSLGLPANRQPVEDPSRPTREFLESSMLAHVRPLSASQTSCSVSAHDAGNGSLVAKWKLPKGGALLGKDLLWETRVRMPKAAAAFWFALWTAGNQWNGGAEMDVVESFGTPNIYPPPAAFHVNSVGGRDDVNYSSWSSGLDAARVPTNGRDLREWHVWTWVYTKDDNYKVYFDGVLVQSGSIHWTLGGGVGGQAIDMDFLFDFGWGHTQISDVNITLAASSFPITYEIDYSRVYLR